VKATKLPVVASGGVADGAGIAALLALGADAVQLGTRFIATPEASVHDNYKQAVLAAEVQDTCLVGPRSLPIRQIKNAFSAKYESSSSSELEEIFNSSSLKKAALEGDVEWGKVEAGQSAGLIDDIVPAADLFRRLVRETEEARRRLASL
jgi:enoyl-[acyl-carrier protein] reductase II